MKIVLQWIILTLTVLATAYFLPTIAISTFTTAIILGAILTFIHVVIRPIINLLTLPINIITFGLFSLVLNGLIIFFLGNIITGFSVANIQAAIIVAVVISILNWIGEKILGKN